MVKRSIRSEHAPAAIGPYSQAVSTDRLLFVSGQIALDPTTNTLVSSGVEDETRRVMKNLEAVLEAAGIGFDQVLKTTIYLTDLQDFATVNRIYGEYFPGSPPARATVQVSALPRGAHVEIDAIAQVGGPSD